MPDVASVCRRLVALATAAACLVLIAPPAAADCCAGGCDETCDLHAARPAAQEHQLGQHEGYQHGQHQGHQHGLHHGHGSDHGDAGGALRASQSMAQPGDHCATACPPSAAARGTATAPAAAWSPVPDAADRLITGFENPPETARPARTADPRGPPSSSSIGA
jgi:hypothetical protein